MGTLRRQESRFQQVRREVNDIEGPTYDFVTDNGKVLYIQRTERGDWGAWNDWASAATIKHQEEPLYRHGQLTHLVAMIEAKERPLGERFNEKTRNLIEESLSATAHIAREERIIDGEAARLKRPLIERRKAITQEIREVIANQIPDVRPADLHLGYWECDTSPTGRCIYNDREDHLHDHCLFCHDPSERK